jgi:hypothetical protein
MVKLSDVYSNLAIGDSIIKLLNAKKSKNPEKSYTAKNLHNDPDVVFQSSLSGTERLFLMGQSQEVEKEFRINRNSQKVYLVKF